MGAMSARKNIESESVPDARWRWPVTPATYDRDPELTAPELKALTSLGSQVLLRGRQTKRPEWREIWRLLRPLEDAGAALAYQPQSIYHQRSTRHAIGLVLHACAEGRTSYWDWEPATWARLIRLSPDSAAGSLPKSMKGARAYLAAFAYLLTDFSDFGQLGSFSRLGLAQRVFGLGPVDEAIERITSVLGGWGYRSDPGGHQKRIRTAITHLLLINHSPLLEDLSNEVVLRVRRDPATSEWVRRDLHGIHRALAALGFADPPAEPTPKRPCQLEGASPAWTQCVERWHATSTLQTRARMRTVLSGVGRWLASEHPDISTPGQWTRQTCAAWLAAVDRRRIGDFGQRPLGNSKRAGEPLAARSKDGYITVVRMFFRDCQEWGWIPRHFDPGRALATPKTIKALIGPDPRVVADDVWAKLLWAGLNLAPTDVPGRAGGSYPLELIRALTATWLFSGLRSDEIARLRVGCIRWQRDDVAVPGRPGDILARDAVCLLDVPINKTGTAFTKPVDPMLGRTIASWETVRPAQPKLVDRKTGERADLLFACRGRRLDRAYINNTIIPCLCRKAGLPTTDARGKITSHRARATIASQLYNAKEPMTLFELQAWLGHRSPESTRHYARATPTKLAAAYSDAGYFARNVRAIEVLIDREAVDSGAASGGAPWQYYDLGHGYCTYSFFEQCPHRMACARCDFYVPKGSSKAQLLEAKANLQRMLATIPLTDEERAAVDEGESALDRLLDRLKDVPTPAGPSPREIDLHSSVKSLPVIVSGP